ncbi:tetratricopeptide repeat protein [Reichenbachiella versicolor]|uniref:hypothetical protein n=1 Tax=Reichenbachiella versicolor TaxID=1821036 RepID=UPI0013A554C2|nr:hypothetical protein [Reichenbachiella versicolor]
MGLKWLTIYIIMFANILSVQADSSYFQKLISEAEDKDVAEISIKLLDEYLSQSQNTNLKELAEFNFLIAKQFYRQKEYLESLSFLLKSREQVIKHGDLRKLECEIIYQSALINYFMNNFTEAQKQFELALLIAKELNETRKVISCVFNIGLAFRNQGKYEASTEKFFECLELAKKNNMSEKISSCLNELGWNSEDIGDLEMASRLYYESGQVSGISQESIAISELNLGHVNLVQNNYRRAIVLLLQAEKRINENYLFTYVPILNSLGRSYYHLKLYDSALFHLNKAFHLNLPDSSNMAYHPAELRESYQYLRLVAEAKEGKYLLTDLGVVEKMAEYNSNLMVNLNDVEKANAQLMIQDYENGLMNEKLESNYLIWVAIASVLVIAMLIWGVVVYYARKRKRDSYKSLLDEIDQSLINH